MNNYSNLLACPGLKVVNFMATRLITSHLLGNSCTVDLFIITHVHSTGSSVFEGHVDSESSVLHQDFPGHGV